MATEIHAARTPSLVPGTPEQPADAPPTTVVPPQGAGAPRRPFSTGSPMSAEKLSVSARILLDPAARMSASRPYSGQARSWRR